MSVHIRAGMCVCVHVRERQQREYLCDGEGMRVSVFADSPRLSLSTCAVASLNPNASSVSTGLVCVLTRPYALGLHDALKTCWLSLQT